MILFIDTETTGMISRKLPPEFPGQPKILQLGLLQCHKESLEILRELCVMVKIGETEIHPMAQQVHGISKELCNEQGIEPGTACELLLEFAKGCEILCSHNLDFDKFVLQTLFAQCNQPYPLEEMHEFCTMLHSTGPCGLKNSKGGAKWPKLSEAYRILVGSELEGSHQALTDAKACREIFKELRKRSAARTPQSSPQSPASSPDTSGCPSVPVAPAP